MSDDPDQERFATARLRTRVTKGVAFKTAALAIASKLLATAPGRWRRNGNVSSPTRPPAPGSRTDPVCDDDKYRDRQHDETVAG